MSFMKITIITPNYNNEKFICGCIESVMSQNVDFQHIIVDAASNDGSLELIQKYQHLDIISEPDKNMYDAINKGIKIANGDLIAYLNGDDRYQPGALKKVLSFFENSYDYDYAYGHCKFVNDLDSGLYTYKTPFFTSFVSKYTSIVAWAQPSVFWRRQVFDLFGNFDIQYSLAGDYEFMKRIELRGAKGKRINMVLSRFMIRSNALSSTYFEKMALEVCDIKKLDAKSIIG